jgi:hypothetical protein
MVTVAFLGIAAISKFRSSVTRQVDGLIQNVRLVDLAEAALSEVANSTRLRQVYNQPGNKAALLAAFASGTITGGVLVPNGGAASVEPTLVRARLGVPGKVEFGSVEVRPVEYLPALNKGRMRFTVVATVVAGPRTYRRTLAQDYEFALLDLGGGNLGFLMPSAPVARLYP